MEKAAYAIWNRISAYCLLMTGYPSLWLPTVTQSVPNAEGLRDNMAAD